MPATLTRRTFLAMSAMLPWALSARGAAKAIPVGIELYTVRDELKRDPDGTVRAVAKMGYQCVEFYAPYFDWSEARANQMRSLLDDLGIRCSSTLNEETFLLPGKIQRAADMNSILGSRYLILANIKPANLDGWKRVADELNAAAELLERSGLGAGYHNHEVDFTAVNGHRPIEILAANTKPSIMLQLDVGTCIEAGSDPVAWIRSNPGRIQSMHCKDWSPADGKGYSVLFGEGAADWKNIFAAAESVGGLKYYLVEQEGGSRYPELETAERCLQAFRHVRPD